MKNFLFLALSFFSVSLFGQTPITTIPFELVGNHIIIKLSVDDSEPLDFIFDTGDGLTVLDLSVAKKLKLPLDHKKVSTSIQGTITGAAIKHNKFAVNQHVMESNIKIYATSINHLSMSIGRKIDGIIGYDLLKHHGVRIDYDNMQFEVYKKGEAPKTGEEIIIKMVNAIPVVNTTVILNNGEAYTGDFYLNTGAGTTMDFNTPFAVENDVINKTGEHYFYLIKGLGDVESTHYEGKVQSFNLGKSEFQDFPIGISQAYGGVQGDKKTIGIIGNRLLSRYNMSIDESKGKIYLEPNRRFSEPFHVSCSGLDLQLDKSLTDVLIHKVIENSPASKAGIQVNDILISINGQKAAELGIAATEALLNNPGTTVKLVIQSGGEEREIELKLVLLI